jgi:TRAP transporter TAXI family solute receptor
MPRKSDWRHGLSLYAPAGLLVVAAFVLAYQFVQPAPPRLLTLAAGESGGAYHAFAARYRDRFAREGIEIRVLETAGSGENLDLLREGQADVAFVQGGMLGSADPGGLTALGSLYFEPLWLFHRRDLELDRLSDLRGRRIAVGPPDSGTRVLVERLLEENGIAPGQAERAALASDEAADALLASEVDAVFLVAAPEARTVARLLTCPGVELASFRRAPAYARRHRFLTELVLPEGAVDLAANVPAREVKLLAPAATLVAAPDLHPALVDLLLQAAREVHGEGGWFEAPGRFPSREFVEFPLNAEAERFYTYGPPFLQRYLPFWAASLVDRLKVMLLPLVVLLIPLARFLPPVYNWRMRSRVYRWYRELEAVDESLGEGCSEDDKASALVRLRRVESDVRRVDVPLSFAHQLYHLRQHIELVRRRIG